MKYIVELKKEIRVFVVAEADSDAELDRKLTNGEYDWKTEIVTTKDTYLGCEYVSYKECKSPVVSTPDEFFAEVGCRDENHWNNALFKYTKCGCCGCINERGVSVNGYAEGSDVECPVHFLPFPFEMNDYYEELDIADQEGCDLWDECHDEDGNEI